MAKPELGLKRVCVACNAKFYDLMKSPAVCPKCGTEQPAEQPRARRPGAAASAAAEQRKRPVPSPVPEDVEVEVEADETEDDAVLEDADELEDNPDELAADIEVEPNDGDEDR
ncbi:TIGR02300 family protein [Elioraea rosea]|uniref:TIGR02300 family protein n=1 Tax=Elioraea rosea TaxID=2492390 RepID=UPI001184D80C|nr:TIGR02300 family protein [Elioraea rosea]